MILERVMGRISLMLRLGPSGPHRTSLVDQDGVRQPQRLWELLSTSKLKVRTVDRVMHFFTIHEPRSEGQAVRVKGLGFVIGEKSLEKK